MAKTPGGDDPGGESHRPSKRHRDADEDVISQMSEESFISIEQQYKPFSKAGYKRLFPDNATDNEFCVYIEGEKVGNKNPLMLAGLFKNEIKGVTNIRRINANKVGVTFSQANNANNLIKNEEFLNKYTYKAYIPARAVEKIGVLRFVPTNISNEELFKKLSSAYEIINVRRFTKKIDGVLKPMGSVSVTFLTNVLPDYVYLDIFRYKVYEYIAPLLQCYKCLRFNHGAKICNAVQKCSICAGEHHFSKCDNDTVKKCINCGGQHLAISRECPIKKAKITEKYNKISYANAILKTQDSNLMKNYNTNFPPIKPLKSVKPATSSPEPISKEILINEILNSDIILKGLIGTLVTLGNGNRKLTSTVIKEVLIKQLKNG
jgi:hypothetical protein